MRQYLSKFRNYLTVLLFFSISITFAQVGINTTDPKSTLDVNGSFSLREGPALTLNNGNNTNIDLGSTIYSQYRITGPTSDFSILTFLTPNNQSAADGQLLTLINTTDYKMTIVHNQGSNANQQRRIYCPSETNFVLSDKNASVTLQYNVSESRWMVASFSSNASGIDSVTLAADELITSTNFSNVPGMNLTFTAKKNTALVLLTASGFGYTNSMSLVNLRVRNGNTTIGGTTNKVQSFDDIVGTVTAWNASFSKMLTGLTVGNTYTFQVQVQVEGIFGTPGVGIYPQTNPDSHHLTLSVLQ